MPGTPPTSPRFGVPRYADGDTAQFSTQVNAITDALDAAAAKRANVVAVVAGATPTDAEVAVTVGGVTLTLSPSPTIGDVVRIVADDSATGLNPVTIQAQGGATIHGRGLGSSGVTQIVLGTPGACVALACVTATKWQVVAGAQDAGWLTITVGTNVAFSGGYLPEVRARGDMVEMCGNLKPTTTGITALGTVPSAAIPGSNVQLGPFPSFGLVTIDHATGAITCATAPPANTVLGLDGLSYRLTN